MPMDVNSALSSLVYSGETVSSYDLGQAVLATATAPATWREQGEAAMWDIPPTDGPLSAGRAPSDYPLTPDPGSRRPEGRRSQLANNLVSLADSYTERQYRFRSSVNEALRNEEFSFTNRAFIKGLTQGELLKAAQAYEHLRPDLWPFNSVRKFDALKHNNWMRLARAAMFIELERRRLSSVEDFDQEAYDDANHEITRLQNKAIEQRWPSGPQEEEMDPF
jgi:hypothetical protein